MASLFADTAQALSSEERQARPAPVLAVSTNVKVSVALVMPVSFYAVFALFAFRSNDQPLGLVLGIICAVLCCAAIFVFCWSSVFAYFIRRLNLSPSWCNWAGWPFILAGISIILVAWFGTLKNLSLGTSLCWIGAYTARLCRKLAYPATIHTEQSDK
jgi:hypothetical protein